MLINSQRKFARRIAEWLEDSNITANEMTERITRFEDDFIELIVKEHRKLLEERKKKGR